MSHADSPSKSSKRMLAILNLLAFQGRIKLYEGTANPKAVAKRRTRNRHARISRRINRG